MFRYSVYVEPMKLTFATLFIIMVLHAHTEAQNNSSSRNTKETIICNGLERTYILHLPAAQTKAGFYPLVIVLHGGGGNAKGMLKLTEGRFDIFADQDGFLVVYPNGVGKHWNDARKGEETGYSAQKIGIDDVGFISDLIDKMINERKADPSRVYVTGMSNGGMMAYRCGCELSNKITAIAPVAGNMPSALSSLCKPARPVSLLVVNGTKDPLMPYSGGEVTGPFGKKKLGKVLSVKESIAYWVKIDECSEAFITAGLPDKDPSDGTRVNSTSYKKGKDNSEVLLYTVEGGGHAWPGGYPYLGEWIIGKTSRDIDASEVIWEFFKRH